MTGKVEASRNTAVSLAKRSDSQLTGSIIVYSLRNTTHKTNKWKKVSENVTVCFDVLSLNKMDYLLK
jgi:hypothetical protein